MATSMSPTAITFNDGTTQSSAGATGVVTLDVYGSSGTWTKPATVKSIKVTVVGGGGNGGSTPVTNTSSIGSAAGGGGGGGAAIRVYPAPSLPGPQPYTVGAATATSSFGGPGVTVVSATGGVSGTPAGPAAPSAAGAGGSGSGGNFAQSGQAGVPGGNSDLQTGGGNS